MPKLSTLTSSIPAAVSLVRSTLSAIGERQMLPEQTMATRSAAGT